MLKLTTNKIFVLGERQFKILMRQNKAVRAAEIHIAKLLWMLSTFCSEAFVNVREL